MFGSTTRSTSSPRFGPSPPLAQPARPATSPATRTPAAHRRTNSCRIGDSLLVELASELGLPASAVHHLALQLAAGGVDVVAARAADHGQHLLVQQDLL